jgi:amino acid adenylation domain-containing protein
MYEREATIDAVFVRRAQERPAAIAVLGARGERLTYAELDRTASRVANFLCSRGIRQGDRVGVAFERSLDLPAVLLGILRAGAAYVPLDPSYPSGRLQALIEDAGVAAIVGSGAAVPAAGRPVIEASAATGHADDRRPADPGDGGSLAYVMYTSGSTGHPKGVAVEQRGVTRLVCATDYVAIGEADTFLHLAPLAFDASTFEIWAPLLNGACLAIAAPGVLGVDEIAAAVARHGVTTLWLTASIFNEFVDAGRPVPQTLRQLLVGGDVVSPEHARRFIAANPACRLINGYGPTENTTFSCCYPIPSADAIADTVPIGKPIRHTTAHVLDDDMRPVEDGAVGELYVGGDGVARGYLNLPAQTAERFIPDPSATHPGARLFRTGDRVRRRADGVLEFCGRADGQVKVRGFRIELGEIEAALRAQAAVRDAAVTVGEIAGYKEIVGHIVIEPDVLYDERALRANLAETLPAFMLPNRIATYDALPRNPSGKLDRGALERSRPRVAPAAPRFGRGAHTELERTIGGIWRELLGCDGALDQNFFDAGGDSLRLLAMRARLQQRLNVDLSVTDLFEQSTIRKLASFVSQAQARA